MDLRRISTQNAGFDCLKQGWLILCLTILLSTFVAPEVNAAQSLVFGILPVESPVALFKHFAPLRDYLMEQAHKEIVLETARDFPEYAKRTAERHYDIVFTAPHMVIPAVDSGHYQLAATFTKPLAAVIVVIQDSAIKKAHDLAGKRIATPPRQAIVTRVGTELLRHQGVLKNHDTELSDYRSHNAAYRAVLAGDADAAIISNYIYQGAVHKHLPLRQISESKPFPGMGILVASDLSETIKTRIKNALINMTKTSHGRSLLKTISQPGYKAEDVSAFASLRHFVHDSHKTATRPK